MERGAAKMAVGLQENARTRARPNLPGANGKPALFFQQGDDRFAPTRGVFSTLHQRESRKRRPAENAAGRAEPPGQEFPCGCTLLPPPRLKTYTPHAGPGTPALESSAAGFQRREADRFPRPAPRDL